MRTIKFRVYIPDHKKFSYFQLGDFDYSDRYLHQHSYPVQQFIGLFDKNGKEIYEGDLLEFAYRDEGKQFVGEVQYFEKLGSFGVVTDKAFETFLDLIDYTRFFNVVGNIFESKSRHSTGNPLIL